MKTLFLSIAVFAVFTEAHSALAAEKPHIIIPAAPSNGIFFAVSHGTMRIVIELKDGYYKYWISSDCKFPKDEKPQFPITGKYTINKEFIQLEGSPIVCGKWACRSIDGVMTL